MSPSTASWLKDALGCTGELSTDSQPGAGDGGHPQPLPSQPGLPLNVRSTLSGDGIDYFNTLSVEGAAHSKAG